MIAPAGEALKRTALNATHRASGAKMVDYCGWDMPVEYSGITREHLAVRTAAGLFDVSHMGEIDVRGPQALALLQYVTSNDVSRLQDNQAQYTALMLPEWKRHRRLSGAPIRGGSLFSLRECREYG